MRIKALICILILLGSYDSASAVESATKKALVIGNSKYGGNYDLVNPRNDANDMSNTLRELGFDVTTHLDLDLRGMKRVVSSFSESLKGSDTTGLIYYAGHAVEEGGINYLLPISFEVNSAADLEYEAIDVQRIVDNLQASRKGLNIVMIDACRNNPFRGFRSLGRTRGVSQMNAPLGTFISSSTASGDYAEDGVGNNSPYTAAVLRHIKEPGLSLEQVFKRVRIDVLNATGGAQVPWESSSITSDFYFAGELFPDEIEEIAKDELVQQQIKEQVERDKQESEKLAALLRELEDQKEKLQSSLNEQQRLEKLLQENRGSVSESRTATNGNPNGYEQRELVDRERQNYGADLESQKLDVEKSQLHLEEEKRKLLAKRESKIGKLLDLCDSMKRKYKSPLRAYLCYQDILVNEDPNNSRAKESLFVLEQDLVKEIEFSLRDENIRKAKRNIKFLQKMSSPLYAQYYSQLNDLIEKKAADQKSSPTFITTF